MAKQTLIGDIPSLTMDKSMEIIRKVSLDEAQQKMAEIRTRVTQGRSLNPDQLDEAVDDAIEDELEFYRMLAERCYDQSNHDRSTEELAMLFCQIIMFKSSFGDQANQKIAQMAQDIREDQKKDDTEWIKTMATFNIAAAVVGQPINPATPIDTVPADKVPAESAELPT